MAQRPTWIVTGGAGFIGSNFVLKARQEKWAKVVNLDLLTYAGNPENLASLKNDADHVFVQGDICDSALLVKLFQEHKPQAVVHFAAESHVDRSITNPESFLNTNVTGTFRLLAAARDYWKTLPEAEQKTFRFLHVSTDEVYGSLSAEDPAFTETTPYQPNSPYSASKAASDHFVRAFFHTYHMPTLVTNCSNNYGPYQFPEKLIPLTIVRALDEKPIGIYGDGKNVRDWLYVEDHVDAIQNVLMKGTPGETYNVGSRNEQTNIDLAHLLCEILDEMRPRKNGAKYKDLIHFVTDRPGHDRRYAIDNDKIEKEIGWYPQKKFREGLRKTVAWYLENESWWQNILKNRYAGERLGKL